MVSDSNQPTTASEQEEAANYQAWLSRTLNTIIDSFTSKQVGTGQVSNCHRLQLKYSASNQNPGPASVILKVASTDPKSRQSGISLRLYEREVYFYQEVASMFQDMVPKCYHASFNPSTGGQLLLLSDAGASVTGDDIKGASVEQAREAVATLGKIHGIMLRDSEFAERIKWFERPAPLSQALFATLFAGFEQRYADRVSTTHLDICRRLVSSYDASQKIQENSAGPKGLVHGDYRLDNLLFRDQGMLVVDWQTVFIGPILADLAYFLGCSLRVEDRRAHVDELIDVYLEMVGYDTGMTRELVLEGLRDHSFFGIVMAIVSPMMVERTDRGDEMFMTMLERHCEAVIDLKALAILPEPEILTPLSPNPKDEHSHPPTDEELWNESWYFDLVDEKSGVGVYVRLGRYPNLEGSWYTAVITHPTKHLIAVTDYKCPHPGQDLEVKTAKFHATHTSIDPLKQYRVTLKGKGEQFDDPAAVLRDEKGNDIDLEFDATWHTDGTPYAWRMATRYEIPCRATGRLAIDGVEITFKDAAAQRDHSHGVRDWVSTS
jgi:hypothetical protein